MGIVGGKGCKLQQRAERKNEFGVRRQAAFLKSFANSCNIKKAAAETGVSVVTVWARRRDDEQFREAFDTARDQAVANLRSELVARGLELLRAATPDETAAAAFPGMDAKFLLSLVQMHQRNLDKGPGEAQPRRNDPNEAAARLQALLVRMRMEHQREAEERRLERLERLERKR